ncbi:MAG TPA: ABC transporter permease [Pirellulaceae bacterium]|nr:ABC transporter permease [Pirellulaceae bacterium]
MPFEHHVMTYWTWLFGDPLKIRFLDASTWGNIGFLLGALIILFVLSIGAPFVWFLLAAVKHGPSEAFYLVARAMYGGVTDDLPRYSFRRTFAVARVAIQEAIRNKVLIGFGVFLLLLLFAGLFLDVENVNPARTYLSIVLATTNYLLLVMTLFLSAFSLPNDIKNRTIYTVVTKPIRAGEIVLGRVAGFMAVATLMLVAMCAISYVFVWRGLSHTHTISTEDIRDSTSDKAPPGTREGITSTDQHHHHTFRIEKNGTLSEVDQMGGHFHRVDVVSAGGQTVYRVGANRGDLIARAPVFGSLMLYGRDGTAMEQGINVGDEWMYRGFIEGGNNRSAAVWTFTNVTPERYSDPKAALPLEMNLAVFRTYKGDIERGVLGEITIRNPNPDAKVKSSGPIPFESREFRAHRFPIPRELNAAPAADGRARKIDLFRDLVHEGQVEVSIRCVENSQYFGVAQADVYLRPSDSVFAVNFAKGFFSIWLQMLLVTTFGVMFSTFLSGPVAALATAGTLVVGLFGGFIRDVTTGVAYGGGPIESFIRMVLQQNVMTDLEVAGWMDQVIKVCDKIMMGVIYAMTFVLPNYLQLDTSQFVASGYDIYADLLGQHVTSTLLYFAGAAVVGYFFLKTREIAG